MRYIKYFVVLPLVVLTACSTGLTRGGVAVRLATDKEREKCDFIAVVAGSMSMGVTSADNAESAVNEARNKAAAVGANAIRLINQVTNSSGTTVTAEALKCKS